VPTYFNQWIFKSNSHKVRRIENAIHLDKWNTLLHHITIFAPKTCTNLYMFILHHTQSVSRKQCVYPPFLRYWVSSQLKATKSLIHCIRACRRKVHLDLVRIITTRHCCEHLASVQ
jgi:hypothetical protein